MEQVNLDLKEATWRGVGNCNYPALELKIGDKLAYIYQPDLKTIDDGFVYVDNLDGETDWKTLIPAIKLEESVAKRHGLEVKQKGATNDPRIVQLAREFWEAINSSGKFLRDRKVFSEREGVQVENM
jgi:hypothetical protein